MNNRLMFLSVALLAVAAVGCSSIVPPSTALYKDNFSDSGSGWCVDSTASSSTDYVSGEYVFKVSKDHWFVWCNPGQNFDNIHVEVTARNVGKTTDTVFGVVCNDQKNAEAATESLYYLGFSPDGYYTITLTKNGEDQVLKKGTSPDIATSAISYTVGADCGGGQLALYADGKKIATASDSSYTTGDVGLFAWTSDGVPAEIHYDNIVVTKLASGTPTK